MDTKYNGWKNRATWNIALWLGNDEGLYRFALECAQKCPRNPYGYFLRQGFEGERTPDGFKYAGRAVCRREINDCMREMAGN